MHIGVPKERRPFEFRVGLPPAGVNLFTKHGHIVYIETEAGEGAGFTDEDYSTAGGQIVYNQEEIFGRPDLIMKFARPLRVPRYASPASCTLPRHDRTKSNRFWKKR